MSQPDHLKRLYCIAPDVSQHQFGPKRAPEAYLESVTRLDLSPGFSVYSKLRTPISKAKQFLNETIKPV